MKEEMTIDEIFAHVLRSCDGVIEDRNWGERGIFYNPGKVLPKSIYVLTIKDKDSPNDKASQVNRPGVFRLNLGISRPAFTKLFGDVPSRPT
ncbi:DUF6194 family protein [Thioclava sp. FR2]|uniref:DUF6194 family protein n=1 Tax=Thioclava sp. FR2 TaxID=3445780 RepID=UPI003EB91CD2